MAGQHTPPEPTHVPGTTKGEELGGREGGEDRPESGTNEAGRATGTSTPSDYTGIDPESKGPIDPDSPTLTTP